MSWTEDKIKHLLLTNNMAVERGILAIYDNQTRDEQTSESTLHSNGIGFSGSDASLGTYYAKWLRSGKHLNGDHLNRARKMTLKYRKQLSDIANKR